MLESHVLSLLAAVDGWINMARTLPKLNNKLSPHAPDLLALGLLVRERRAQGGLRIDVAANLIGVSKSVLSRLENGKPVGVDKLFKVLDGLGLNLMLFDHLGSRAVLLSHPTFVKPDDLPGQRQ